jgi:ribosomal protein S9
MKKQQPQSHIARYDQETSTADQYLQAEQKGKGLVKVNGKPLSLVQPEILRFKVAITPSLHPTYSHHPNSRSTSLSS